MKRHIKYDALVLAAKACDVELPAAYDEAADEAALRRLHHALNEIHVIEGCLICPASGRRSKINNGIPNMLLDEDEITDTGAGCQSIEPGDIVLFPVCFLYLDVSALDARRRGSVVETL